MKNSYTIVKSNQKTYVDYFLSKPSAQLVEDTKLCKIITYEDIVKGTYKPCLACFVGTQPKPKLNLFFPSFEERFKTLEDFKYSTILSNRLRNERRKLRRIFAKMKSNQINP
ncbi:MAG TPA: hypothetical protein PKW61_00135 [Tenuifilaceae bacterium]|nr:hypothetical protein [Tenuifilaceae bacterium]